MRPTSCSVHFGSSVRFWKVSETSLSRRVASGGGTHPFVWSLIKEEKQTLELLLEYVINARSLHGALLWFPTYRFWGWEPALRELLWGHVFLLLFLFWKSKGWIFKSSYANTKFKCLDLQGTLLANKIQLCTNYFDFLIQHHHVKGYLHFEGEQTEEWLEWMTFSMSRYWDWNLPHSLSYRPGWTTS